MKISFGQQLQQKQTQTLAPRMIQSMEVLQMAEADLVERIERELSENETLERSDPVGESTDNAEMRTEEPSVDVDQKELVIDQDGQNSADDFERLLNLDRDVPDHFDGPKPSSNRIQEIGDRQHDMMANLVDREDTLQDHLLEQLANIKSRMDAKTYKMCERIISSLNAADGGYFKVSLQDLLPPDSEPGDIEKAEDALAWVQEMDPQGVAARDLKECLQLQLGQIEDEYRSDVRVLINNHLEDLQHNRMPLIQKATGMTIDEIKEAWGELKRLDPKPASRFASRFVPTVTPDVKLVIDAEGNYVVQVDEGPARSLRISAYYRKRLENGQATAEEREFIKRKITSAQWLIDAIEQRRNTLQRVAQRIVDHQKRFFEEGPDALEPLKMQQIADLVGVHVTTVSRAVDDKWMESPRGIFPLKYFFQGGTTNAAGDDVAWNKIRIELQKIIDEEDKAKPYSDDELVQLLKSRGLKVARRTVTKYRKKMQIPSSRQRRDWSQKS